MKKRLKKNMFYLVLGQLKEFWYAYILAIVCLFFTHLIQSYIPEYAKELAELVSGDGIKISIFDFFLMAVGIVLFRTSSRLLFFWPARVLEKNLRAEMLTRLENTPPVRYISFSSGQLFQIINNDFDQIRALIGFVFLQLGNIVIALSIIIPKIVLFEARLLFALLPLFFGFLIFSFVVGRRRIFFKRAQDMQGELQNYIMESYNGKDTIKNFNSEESFIDLFSEYSMRELYNFYKAGRGLAWARPIIPFVVGLSLLWGAYIVHDLNLGTGSLILFSGFVFLLLEPFIYVSWIGVIGVRASVSWKRIVFLLKTIGKESFLEKRLYSLNHDVQKSESEKMLKVLFWDKELPISMKISCWTALVGKTGCGKTEVLYQLASVLKMKGGKVSLVSQNPYLYNDTVYNNIFLGRVATEEEKELACKFLELVGLDYIAQDRQALFDLEVGENGKKLSGGQAKRLALVRSLLEDSDYFLWDDPFSAVDVILEKDIIGRVMNEFAMKNKTFILTSHRVSTIRFCDRIIFLDKMEGITECGVTNKLLNSKTRTHAFFKNQLV